MPGGDEVKKLEDLETVETEDKDTEREETKEEDTTKEGTAKENTKEEKQELTSGGPIQSLQGGSNQVSSENKNTNTNNVNTNNVNTNNVNTQGGSSDSDTAMNQNLMTDPNDEEDKEDEKELDDSNKTTVEDTTAGTTTTGNTSSGTTTTGTTPGGTTTTGTTTTEDTTERTSTGTMTTGNTTAGTTTTGTMTTEDTSAGTTERTSTGTMTTGNTSSGTQTPPQTRRDENLATDAMRNDIAASYIQNNDGEGRETGEQEEENGTFDTLEELQNLASSGQESDQQAGSMGQTDNGGQGGDKLGKVRKDIRTARTGGLYKAVILARMLEKGGSNPAKKVDNHPRLTRFLNSSRLNKAADINTMVASGSAIAANFDTNYKESFVGKAVTLVTSMLAMISSIRNIIKKIRGWKNLTSKLEKAFTGISLISDFAVTASKAAAIAKTIAEMAGAGKGVFAKVMNYVSTIGGGISQIANMVGITRTLGEQAADISILKKNRSSYAKIVDGIIKDHENDGSGGNDENLSQQDSENSVQGDTEQGTTPVQTTPATVPATPTESTGSDQGTPQTTPTTPTGPSQETTPTESTGSGQETTPTTLQTTPTASAEEGHKRSNLIRSGVAKLAGKENKARREKVSELLKSDKISKSEKDRLLTYWGISRRIKRKKSDLINSVGSGIGLVLGMGTTILTGVSIEDESAKEQSKIASTVSNSWTLLTTGKKFVDKKLDKKDHDKNAGETQMMQDKLWGIMKTLGQNKYGLKGVAKSLEGQPDAEKQSFAEGLAEKYKKADAQFDMLGVDYSALMKAEDEKKFKQLLVAGL